MASLLANHSEIEVVRTVNNTTERTESPQEKAGQTFVKGTPVQLNAGVLQAWDGTTVAAGIYGVAAEDAHNLATDGAGFPAPFGVVGFPGTGTTFGKVPFQASAVNIPEGAPPVKGLVVCWLATLDTIFRAQTDNGSGSATTPTKANIGTLYGLTVDANGHWYVDFNKTTVGTNTVVQMVDLDPIDGSSANARILFTFTKAAQQLTA
jgi:hypothetical protein